MKILVSALLAFSCLPLIGVESKVEGIAMSDFDADGRRLHRLTAVSATGPITDPKLNDGWVEFFDVQGTGSFPVGVLTFAEANFHRSNEEIEGDGPICYRDAHGTIQGRGFKYRMSDGYLTLRSEVVLATVSAHVVAKEGDAFMAKDPKASRFGVTTARLLGGVIVTGKVVEKLHADRAETASATYTASDELLTLASPVTTWSGDKKSVAEAQKIQFYVGKPTNQTIGTTPAAAIPPAGQPQPLP